MKLSVLVPSIHTRWDGFGQRIQQQIWQQYNKLPAPLRDKIEVLIVTDNKQRPIGDKRNAMLQLAQGEYVAFVDDDDVLADTYLYELFTATYSGADVIVFDVEVTRNGKDAKVCRYSRDYHEDQNYPTHYERLPNHIMCVKRELALQAGFPSWPRLEDAEYAKRLQPLLTSEHRIPRTLYHYQYSDSSSEMHGR